MSQIPKESSQKTDKEAPHADMDVAEMGGLRWGVVSKQDCNMGPWRSTGRQFSLAAITCLFAASFAREIAAAKPYLAKTGPVPLRFAPASNRTAAELLPPLAMNDRPAILPTNSAPSLTNAATPLAEPPITAVTNSATNELSSASNTNSSAVGPISLDPYESLSVGSTPPVQVTPQMLVDYLTPLPGATNGPQANMTVPALIDFTPPIPRPRSQATYEAK